MPWFRRWKEALPIEALRHPLKSSSRGSSFQVDFGRWILDIHGYPGLWWILILYISNFNGSPPDLPGGFQRSIEAVVDRSTMRVVTCAMGCQLYKWHVVSVYEWSWYHYIMIYHGFWHVLEKSSGIKTMIIRLRIFFGRNHFQWQTSNSSSFSECDDSDISSRSDAHSLNHKSVRNEISTAPRSPAHRTRCPACSGSV